MEMSHNEVGVMNVDVESDGREKHSGQATNGEEANEPKGVKHRGLVGNGTLIKCGRPIEDFNGGRDSDQKAKDRKDQAGIDRLAAHEHVMSPNQEANHCNRQ